MLKIHRLHEPEQSRKMISMPVRYEYVAYAHEVQARAEYLPLRSFTAVEQIEEFVLALVAQVNRRMIPVFRRHACRCAKKRDLYLCHKKYILDYVLITSKNLEA